MKGISMTHGTAPALGAGKWYQSESVMTVSSTTIALVRDHILKRAK